MTHVLVTVAGGIIDQVTFYDCRRQALGALANFVKGMNPEKEDAAVFCSEGLVLNAKNLLDETDRFVESHDLFSQVASCKGKTNCIYLIGNPDHPLGFMVASPDDPLGYEDPAEALSELSQMRSDASNHLRLYRVVPVEEPIVTRTELERYITENEIEDSAFPLVEEYVVD